MKYYNLTLSNDLSIVGKYPQSEWGKFGDIQQNFIPWQGKIDFDFKLPEPVIEKKTKLTSLLSVSFIRSTFLIINDEFLNFLRNFNLGNFQEWKINTWSSNKELIENYNLFILNDTEQDKLIDFSKSEFISKKLGDWNNSSEQKQIIVKNYSEYISVKEKLRKNGSILIEKNVCIDLKLVNTDLFRIVNAPPGGYYVSEKLKNTIENYGFTGMKFTEISELENISLI